MAASTAAARADSVATEASDRVRAIVEAAETSSREIVREAKQRAEETRERAAGEARAHVARVAEATAAMQQRVDALSADLALLQDNMGELRTAAGGSDEAGVAEEALAEDAATAPVDEQPEPEPEPVEEKEPTVEEKEPTVEEKEPTVEEKEPPVEEPTGDGGDSEGARLIALNMALNGTPREETDRYLAENFDLPDRGSLLDEVYARVG